ncbi:hypothetical protein ACFYW6_33965 [Streptomyces sp. NPDC002659]|uniref:hypothetical protein n=1 Tax=Streptomyces sp. NPDC002659 TaxID=3364656 RepID=UPI0036ABE582
MDKLESTLLRVENAAAALRATLEPSREGHFIPNSTETEELLAAMKEAQLALRAGRLYVLRDPVTLEARYVGETMNSLRVRLSGHRSQRGRLVGQWLAELARQGLEPIVEPMDVVPAKVRKMAEQHRIFQHVWNGCDLLNRSKADDDASAYSWLQERERGWARRDASVPYWNEIDEEWDWEKPEYWIWHSLRHWRHLVRGAHCPECSARPGRPCTGMRQSVASLRHGYSNHLGRVAARVRHASGEVVWAAARR